MLYLYCLNPGKTKKLAATFDSEQQMLAYVRWATLQKNADGTYKFEQGRPPRRLHGLRASRTPLTEDDSEQVPHNPTPSML